MNKDKKIIEDIIQTLLLKNFVTEDDLKCAILKAKENGLEEMLDVEFDKIKRKGSNISFKERALVGTYILSKRTPVTIEEARAQVLWLRTQSSVKNKEK